MSQTNECQDFKVNLKIKISALWISVMFCYVYGDFFSLFVPGRIQDLMKGNSGAGATTPMVLLMYALLLSIPPVMIFLTLILKPKANRLLNIVTGLFFTAVMLLVVATSINRWMVFYVYFGILEIGMTGLLTIYAWRWPKQDKIAILPA